MKSATRLPELSGSSNGGDVPFERNKLRAEVENLPREVGQASSVGRKAERYLLDRARAWFLPTFRHAIADPGVVFADPGPVEWSGLRKMASAIPAEPFGSRG